MISQEQISKLKEQVISQINSSFPEEKKADAIQQINSMDETQFIAFLKQNNLIKDENSESSEDNPAENKTPFRLIVEGKIPSYQIEENKEAIAVLEINPISKSHIIIIPKSPVTDSNKLSKTVFSLAEKISKKIKNKFKPQEVLISSANVLGEIIINVIPKYSNETPNSERKSATKEELESIKQELETKSKIKTIKEPKIKKIETKGLWLPKRLP